MGASHGAWCRGTRRHLRLGCLNRSHQPQRGWHRRSQHSRWILLGLPSQKLCLSQGRRSNGLSSIVVHTWWWRARHGDCLELSDIFAWAWQTCASAAFAQPRPVVQANTVTDRWSVGHRVIHHAVGAGDAAGLQRAQCWPLWGLGSLLRWDRCRPPAVAALTPLGCRKLLLESSLGLEDMIEVLATPFQAAPEVCMLIRSSLHCDTCGCHLGLDRLNLGFQGLALFASAQQC